MEITHHPVTVGIFGTEALAIGQCASELSLAGYALNFPSSFKPDQHSHNDIYIVGISELSDMDNLAQWKNSPSPFLISGIDTLPQNNALLDILDRAVGFIRSAPTLTEILLNLRLGLHWHNERRSHSQRIHNIESKIENNRVIGMAVGVLMNSYGQSEQHVFESLKSVSRNKQRRISSVAHEIITKHDGRNQDGNNLTLSASCLQSWLTNNITMKNR